MGLYPPQTAGFDLTFYFNRFRWTTGNFIFSSFHLRWTVHKISSFHLFIFSSELFKISSFHLFNFSSFHPSCLKFHLFTFSLKLLKFHEMHDVTAFGPIPHETADSLCGRHFRLSLLTGSQRIQNSLEGAL